MDFEITSNLDVIRSQSITANFGAVSQWLDEELAPYQSMIVSDDMIPTAKTYRANIRKVKDRIEQYRKEAKTAALAPYESFAEQCRVLTGKLDNAADNLDRQVKSFEAAEREAKLYALRAVYETESTEELRDYLPWEQLLNPKWGNKSYPADTAIEEIVSAIRETERDLETIRGMGEDDTPYLLDVYRREHDLSAAVRKSAELKATREREALRREREETKKREAEERRRAAEAERTASFAETSVAEKVVAYAPAVTTSLPQDELVSVSFRVTCTRTQLADLGRYMRDSGISYGRVT